MMVHEECPSCKEKIISETNTRWEQHSQSILSAVIVALLVWVGYSVSQNSKDIAVVGNQFNAMQNQISFMQNQLTAATSDKYTGTNAAKDFLIITKQLDEVKADVKEIGREQQIRGPRIKRLEDFHRSHSK